MTQHGCPGEEDPWRPRSSKSALPNCGSFLTRSILHRSAKRDLDPRAEAFIVDWARELPPDAPLALLVHLERACGPDDEATLLRAAIHEYFSQRALHSRRELRELLRRGRISLVIALAFLGATLAANDFIGSVSQSHFAEVFREGLIIGGWVAMWRPLEVFLYDWWPIRADVRLSERLSTMPVSIEHEQTASSEAWRSDWPAVTGRGRS